MDSKGTEELPPPPVVPPNVVPLQVGAEILTPKRAPMSRRGFGSKGQKIQLVTNHFRVDMPRAEGNFYQYNVAFFSEDGHPLDEKGIGRKVIETVQHTYQSILKGKCFAYDGEKCLYSLSSLPDRRHEFTVVLEEVAASSRSDGSVSYEGDGSQNAGDRKRLKRQCRSRTIRVEINYSTRIPIQSIADALQGRESEHVQDALRVLDIILRQQAATKKCLLVRQSFFHNSPRNFTPLGDGILGCRGFHSSFRATQGGLSLNMDVTTTMVLKPGPVLDFLLENQRVSHLNQVDWTRAKRVLKNLRVKITTTNQEYKITGLSEKPCNQQRFSLRQRKEDGETTVLDITVYDYFLHHRKIQLRHSVNFPCVNVGKTKRPTFFPLELCELVSLQRYTKASVHQRASLVEKSRQKPQERMSVLTDGLSTINYNSEPMLRSSGITINPRFIQVEGRVLSAPKLLAGNQNEIIPRNGRWNFNDKELVDPVNINDWVAVNFSSDHNIEQLCRRLVECGKRKGILMDPVIRVYKERQQDKRAAPQDRVDKMYKEISPLVEKHAKMFILCILPERKNSDIYGPWKRKCLVDAGVPTQCIAPKKVDDHYLTNVLLKINAKLGGINSFLAIERQCFMPRVSEYPTLIIGMDVSHGARGRDSPSVAAVVSSRGWPSVSRYRAVVRTQPPKTEMVANLFKPVPNPKTQEIVDDGIFRELLLDFYQSSRQAKPEHIIIFRDGVSESQFNQVLNIEYNQILRACKFLDSQWHPKFTVIIAQKNHHTRFFKAGGDPVNIPPGTVIDGRICHPRNNDFYMCSHAGIIGTSRPTHYHVLLDEVAFSADDLQEVVLSLSYVFQRSTTAISAVAPIRYAHLAAAQMRHFLSSDEFSEASSSHGGLTKVGDGYSEMPKLNEKVSHLMFFC